MTAKRNRHKQSVQPKVIEIATRKYLAIAIVITFLLSDTVTATHRVVGIVDEGDGALRFRTKGDANDAEDAALVHQNNLLGEPVACIPYLGYFAAWVQNPPGSLIAIGAGVFLLALVFLPDLLGGNKEKKKTDASGDEKDTSPNT